MFSKSRRVIEKKVGSITTYVVQYREGWFSRWKDSGEFSHKDDAIKAINLARSLLDRKAIERKRVVFKL